ncbi:aminotransferase class IV [Bacteroides caecigallinarum]|uniref:aminotransferase class IV family protein n=1 Tax=Bacteroides caecigallinarum TaxID=1411144 RepID=UPI00195A8EBE|nr:aminotransferase class IV family protein [Bacteroides caecigallinarum]MBM6959798.1 aminotransferase class IV [Bacteroides caecigallinarum]
MCRFIETICINDGVIENLSAHNERMNNTIRVHYGSSAMPVSLEDFITAEGCKVRIRCRVEYTSAVEKVEYFPYSIREVKSLQLVNDDTAEYSFKYADRSVLDRNFALRGNADDVVIVRSGMLTDTSIANIALYKEGKWFTPKYPLLKGTRRARLLTEGIIEEDIIMADSLHKYEKIRLFNAMISFGEVEIDIKNVFPIFEK